MRTTGVLIIAAVFLSGCGGGKARRTHRDKGSAILMRAKSQKGVPYRYGGRSPEKGFDCSGLAWWSYSQERIGIPRTTKTQYRGGKKISRKGLLPGDLVFFHTVKKSVSHVGVYAGGRKFVHAPRSGKGVRTSSMDNSYWKHRYMGGRRYW